MNTRRDFLGTAMKGAAVFSAGMIIPGIASGRNDDELIPTVLTLSGETQRAPLKLTSNYGVGGVAIGNSFKETPELQAYETLEAAWNAGVRHFDTSPFYGHGLCERRFGHFLHNQDRKDYILSTKVGRVFHPSKQVAKSGNWVKPSPFDFKYDYTAAGVRRSIEDSLQRLGIQSIDTVYIHDLSSDNKDMGDKWTEYFEIAKKGAIPELTKMREEGIIKAWGLGVNTIEPILKTLEIAQPDICLSATQYSLIKHQDALDRLFPACEKSGTKIVVGAPLNAGFLAGVDRYDYSGTIPAGAKEKRAKLEAIAKKYNIDLRTLALQFSASNPNVVAVIPGARTADQARENVASMSVKIPGELWKELKKEGLVSEKAPV